MLQLTTSDGRFGKKENDLMKPFIYVC